MYRIQRLILYTDLRVIMFCYFMEISDVGLRMYIGHVYPHEHNLSKGGWFNLLIAAHGRGVSIRSMVLWYLWAQESGY